MYGSCVRWKINSLNLKCFNLDYNLRRNYTTEHNLPSTDDSFRPYDLSSPRLSEPGINTAYPTDGRVIRYVVLYKKMSKNW